MRTAPPEDFDASAFFADVFLFQAWNVFPGHRTPGIKGVEEHMKRLDVPAMLDGLRVLEIAPWNGFFGFECLRRGARELVAVGPDNPNVTGFNQTVQLLDIEDRVRYIQRSVYHIKELELGKFDLVMLLGLIYHLRHPLLAIDVIHDHCEENAVFLIDSPLADKAVHVFEPDKVNARRPTWEAVQDVPMAMFVRGGADVPLARDPFNWFVPNGACLGAWVRSSGFEILHQINDGSWSSIKARRIARPFAEGLEGFNPRAAAGRNRATERIGPPVTAIELFAPRDRQDSRWHGRENLGSTPFRWTAVDTLAWPGRSLGSGLNSIRIPFLIEISEGFADKCRVLVDGREATTKIEGRTIVAEVTLTEPGRHDIELRTPAPVSPRALRNAPDDRLLGLAIPAGVAD